MHFLNKKFASIVFIATCAFSSQISFAAPPTEKSIEQLVTLSKLDQMFSEGLEGLQPFFAQQSDLIIQSIVQSEQLNEQQKLASEQLAKTMSDFTSSALKNPAVKDKVRDVIRNTYTEAELKAYNQFLSTPEGQSINLKSTKVSIELQSFLENLVKNATENADFEKQIEKILAPLVEK